MKLWDRASGRLIRKFSGYEYAIYAVAFSPDDTHIAAGSVRDVQLIERSSGRLVHTFDVGTLVRSIAISPDGRRLLTGDMDHTVKLWDADTGNVLFARGDSNSITTRPSSAQYSRDGARIAAGSGEYLKFWDAPNGVRVFEGDHRRVAYSPDGTRLLVGGQDTLKLLDASTGEVLRSFAGHSGDVTTVAFSADGKRALAGIGFDGKPDGKSDQGKIKVWDVATGSFCVRCAVTAKASAQQCLPPMAAASFPAGPMMSHPMRPSVTASCDSGTPRPVRSSAISTRSMKA